MVVHDKTTVEDCYVDGKFNDENIKMFEDVKRYIDDLIKKTIENKSVPTESLKRATEPIEQTLADKKKWSLPYKTAVTLDNILLPPLPPNAGTL